MNIKIYRTRVMDLLRQLRYEHIEHQLHIKNLGEIWRKHQYFYLGEEGMVYPHFEWYRQKTKFNIISNFNHKY